MPMNTDARPTRQRIVVARLVRAVWLVAMYLVAALGTALTVHAVKLVLAGHGSAALPHITLAACCLALGILADEARRDAR